MLVRLTPRFAKTARLMAYCVAYSSSVAILAPIGCSSMPLPGTNGTPNGDGSTTPQLDVVIDAVVASAEAVARSVAAILSAKDLQAILEGGLAPPTCPSVGTELNASEILLTLDYGGGCVPSPYNSTFGGVVDGTSFIAFNAFDYALVGFLVDGESIEGTIAGSFVPSNAGTTFIVSVNLTLNDGTNVRGTARVEVEDSNGVFRFVDDALIATTVSGQAISITFSGLVVDAATNGNFLAEAGSAAFDMPSASDGTPGARITIEFTSQTPLDGSVVEVGMP